MRDAGSPTHNYFTCMCPRNVTMPAGVLLRFVVVVSIHCAGEALMIDRSIMPLDWAENVEAGSRAGLQLLSFGGLWQSPHPSAQGFSYTQFSTLRLGIATVSSCRRFSIFSVFWSLVASSCFTCSLRSSFLPAAARSGAGPPGFLQFHAGRRTELCSASKIIPPYATWLLATYLHSYPTLCLANVLSVLQDLPTLESLDPLKRKISFFIEVSYA